MNRSIKYSIRKKNEVNTRELAQIALDCCQEKEWLTDEITIDTLEKALKNQLEWAPDSVVIQASQGDKMIGWVINYIHNAATTEINPWFLKGHPFVTSANYDEIASELIKQAINYSKTKGYTRVEICYPLRLKENNEIIKKYQDFYESLNFSPLGLLSYFRSEVIPRSKEYAVPADVEVKTISSITKDELFQHYEIICRETEGQFFTDLSHKELYEAFIELITCQKCLIEGGSLIFLKEGQLIAFAVVRNTYGKENAHVWMIGVHPDFRRQGFGKALLLLIQQKVVELGFTNISTNIDLMNEAAVKLFEGQGFKPVRVNVNYVWREGKVRE